MAFAWRFEIKLFFLLATTLCVSIATETGKTNKQRKTLLFLLPVMVFSSPLQEINPMFVCVKQACAVTIVPVLSRKLEESEFWGSVGLHFDQRDRGATGDLQGESEEAVNLH